MLCCVVPNFRLGYYLITTNPSVSGPPVCHHLLQVTRPCLCKPSTCRCAANMSEAGNTVTVSGCQPDLGAPLLSTSSGQ